MLLNDPIAQGIHDYHFFRKNDPVIIHAEEFEQDEVLPSWFFRTFSEMPLLEKEALNLVKGTILDVGAGAGCHSLYLQNGGFDVYALDRSGLNCKVMRDRGIKNVIHSDIYQYSGMTFDTILLLMNGSGIAGTLDRLDNLFLRLKSLLRPGGSIIMDSTDLIYLYMEEYEEAWININSDHYYGEMTFQTEYNGILSAPFRWLYVDVETMKEKAEIQNLYVTKIIKGEHYDYLAVLEPKQTTIWNKKSTDS